MKNVCLCLLLFTFLACRSQSVPKNSLDPDEFEKEINTPGIQLLDVRTSAEFSKGYIANAMQADWTNSDQFFERVKYIDKDKPVYIYCLVGGRSAAAADWMRKNGYKKVIELTGGINAWKKAAKELTNASYETQMTMAEYKASIPNDRIVLVDFGADWCPPCVKMKPVIEELKEEQPGKFIVINIDAGIHTNVLATMHIKNIPGFIIYKNGKQVWRREGVVSKDDFLKQIQ